MKSLELLRTGTVSSPEGLEYKAPEPKTGFIESAGKTAFKALNMLQQTSEQMFEPVMAPGEAMLGMVQGGIGFIAGGIGGGIAGATQALASGDIKDYTLGYEDFNAKIAPFVHSTTKGGQAVQNLFGKLDEKIRQFSTWVADRPYFDDKPVQATIADAGTTGAIYLASVFGPNKAMDSLAARGKDQLYAKQSEQIRTKNAEASAKRVREKQGELDAASMKKSFDDAKAAKEAAAYTVEELPIEQIYLKEVDGVLKNDMWQHDSLADHLFNVLQKDMLDRRVAEENKLWFDKQTAEGITKAKQEAELWREHDFVPVTKTWTWNLKDPKLMDYLNEKERIAADSIADDIVSTKVNDMILESTKPIKNPNGPSGLKGGLKVAKGQRGSISPDILFGPWLAAGKTFKNMGEFAASLFGEIDKQKGLGELAPLVTGLYADYTSQLAKQTVGPKPKTLNLSNESRKAGLSLIEIVAGQSISAIRELQDKSPTLRAIADTMMRPELGMGRTTAEGGSIVQNKALRTGEFMTRYENIVSGMSSKDKAAMWDGLNGEPVSGAVGAKVAQMRTVLDDAYRYSQEILGDLQRPYRNNYAPRIYKKHWNAKMRKEWTALMKKHGIGEDSAHDMVLNIVDNAGKLRLRGPWQLSENTTGKGIIHTTARKASNIEKDRVLNIPYNELKPFLDTNPDSAFAGYMHDIIPRVEVARKFGPKGEKLEQMIYTAADELAEQGLALEKWRAKRIIDIANSFQNTYMPDTPAWWRKAQGLAMSGLNMALLPLTTLASLHELVVPMSRTGVSKFIAAAPKQFVDLNKKIANTLKIDIPKTLASDIAHEIYKAGEGAKMERVSDLVSGDYTYWNNLTFRANGLYYFTNASNYAAINLYTKMWQDYFSMGPDKFSKHAKVNPAEALRMQQLADYYGLDISKGMEWAKQGFSKDHPFYEEFKRGAVTFAEDSVLHPNPAVVPMWFSNPYLRIIKHLKQYPYLIGTQVVKSWLNDWAVQAQMAKARRPGAARMFANTSTAILGTVAASMMLSHGVNLITRTIKGDVEDYKDMDTTKQVLKAFDRTGYAASLSPVIDYINYPYKGITGVVAGPTISKVQDLSIALGAGPRDTAREVAKLIPGVRLNQKVQDSVTDFLENYAFSPLRDAAFGPPANKKGAGVSGVGGVAGVAN